MICGECTLCCSALPIPSLNKPEGVLCTHCNKGCTIHESRPEACANFDCLYLEGEGPRPDKSGVIFDKITTRIFYGLVTRDMWRTPEMMEQIFRWNEEGISVVICSFEKGISDVFCAPKHERSKVIQLALEANR